MKFLILTQYLYPEVGASQARLAAFARELLRTGHAVEFVTALPNHPTGRIFPEYRGRVYVREQWEGVPVHRTWLYASRGAGLRRMLNYASFTATSLLALPRIARPDWIFVESPPPSLAVAGLVMARWLHAPLIVNVADLWPDSISALGLVKNRWFLRAAEKLEAFVYRHADGINAITEGVRCRLVDDKRVPPHKMMFLPNAADIEAYRPQPPNEALKAELGLAGKAVVLYAGTHGYAHALDSALQAADRLRHRADIHFLFLGDGSEKPRLIRIADDLRLPNVSFHSPVPASEMPGYLSIACCGLVPQRNVALFTANRPAKTFAIMAAARAVLFAGSGDCARLIEEARAGVTVPPEDPDALARGVITLVDDPALCDSLGDAGRRYVQQNLTWEIVVRHWLRQLACHPASRRKLAVEPQSVIPRVSPSGD